MDALPGYIFLGLLQMIVIPLIFASIILGVASSPNINDLKKTGLLTAAYSGNYSNCNCNKDWDLQ